MSSGVHNRFGERVKAALGLPTGGGRITNEQTDGSTRYTNHIVALVFWVVFFAAGSVAWAAYPAFEEAFGPALAIAVLVPVFVTVVSFAAVLPLLGLVTHMDVGRSHVVLGYVHKEVRIDRADVRLVRMQLPLKTSLQDPKWLRASGSTLLIEMEDGTKTTLGYFPNGVKLRVARALDPVNYVVPQHSP